MTGEDGYTCRCCGQWHDGLAFAYGVDAPAYWSPELGADAHSVLEQEICIIGDERFFVRALVRLPVLDADEDFEWGVWVSLSSDNFTRMADVWEQEGREAEPPMFGWLSTELPVYEPSTINLKTMVHTRPVGLRPLVELEPTDHLLSVEQREGISLARVQEFAELLQHAGRMSLRYDDAEPRYVEHKQCDHCRTTYLEVRGFLLKEDHAYGLVFVACHDHEATHEAWIDVILGTFGDNDNSDHVTFGCRVGPVAGQSEPAATAVDAAAPYDDNPIWGTKLTRDEALNHPRIGDFWDVVDFLLLSDPDVHAHVYTQPRRGRQRTAEDG
jgi:hypothetical protein